MQKCGVVGCTRTVVGGFQEVLKVPILEDPNATILGMQRFWCAIHESSLNRNLPHGHYLRGDKLK